MSGFGLFVALFGGVMGWAGWHNYAVWDVIRGVISGQHVDPNAQGHQGGDGLKHLFSFDWSRLTGSLFGGSLGKVPGNIITSGAGEATSGGKPVPGLGGLLGGPGSKGGLLSQ